MKKIVLLLSAVALISLLSCGSNSEGSGSKDKKGSGAKSRVENSDSCDTPSDNKRSGDKGDKQKSRNAGDRKSGKGAEKDTLCQEIEIVGEGVAEDWVGI